MFLFFYNTVLSLFWFFLLLIFPFRFLYFYLKKDFRKQRKIAAGLGFRKKPKADIWLHAVSGGEVRCAEKIVNRFSDKKFFLTTMSDNGFLMAEKIFAGRDNIAFDYSPFDFFWTERKSVMQVSPQSYIVIEHDLWPNRLRMLKNRGCRRMLLNARLMPRDAKRWQRFRFLSSFIFNIDLAAVQNGDEAERFARLFPDIKTVNSGNLKYDFSAAAPAADIQNTAGFCFFDFLKNKEERKVITFGSSHEGEELLLLEAVSSLNVLPVLIPRHVNRAAALKKKFGKIGNTLLLSEIVSLGENGQQELFSGVDLVIADLMGFSLKFYEISDLVLIGDTFIPSQGGHNFLEALCFGVPVIYGMEMKSFADITPQFEKSGAVFRCANKNLSELIRELLEDDERLKRAGEQGLALLRQLGFDFKILEQFIP